MWAHLFNQPWGDKMKENEAGARSSHQESDQVRRARAHC